MTVPEINDETLIVNSSVSITRITFNARTGRQNLRLTVEKASFCFNDLEQHTKEKLDGQKSEQQSIEGPARMTSSFDVTKLAERTQSIPRHSTVYRTPIPLSDV